ncbi:MAG TPA: hypothetical protein VKU02_15875 [Gemmataceae bacterium]|nr:hypothetical protein [Gemmataceae bacterium]
MGMKPGIALIGVVWTGITLSGCESCAACKASKPWGQDATAAAASSSNPSGYPTSAWGNQGRTITSTPLPSSGAMTPASQSARVTDPGLNSAATSSALSPAVNSSTTPASATGFTTNAPDNRFSTPSQPTATVPSMSSAATSSGSMDQSSRISNTGTATTPAPQMAWPMTPSSTGSGMGMKAPDSTSPSTTATGNSSYQTRYPDVQPAATVPSTPRFSQGGNE